MPLVLGLWILLAGTSESVHAELDSNATARVSVHVGTIVEIDGGGTAVAESHQTGEIEVDAEFRVSANVGNLWFQSFASDLFKAGDPQSHFSIPHHEGVLLTIPRSMPLAGSSFLPYLGGGPADTHQGFPLFATEAREWESSSYGTFTRDLVARFTWLRSHPLLPSGTYAGYVKLTAYSLSPW